MYMANEQAWTPAEVIAQIARTHRLAQEQNEAVRHFAHFDAGSNSTEAFKDFHADLQDAFVSQMAQFDVNENGV